MDINLVLLKGILAVTPELEYTEDGTTRARMLVLVRSGRGHRVDVVPAVVANVEPSVVHDHATSGRPVFLSGTLMRRCEPNRAGRLEIIADRVTFADSDGFDPLGRVHRS